MTQEIQQSINQMINKPNDQQEIKPFLFVDSMEVFVENRKESTKNLL